MDRNIIFPLFWGKSIFWLSRESWGGGMSRGRQGHKRVTRVSIRSISLLHFISFSFFKSAKSTLCVLVGSNSKGNEEAQTRTKGWGWRMACIRDRELGKVKGRNRYSKILYANFFTTVTRWSSITSTNSCIISFNSSFSFSGSFSGYDLIKLHWWPQSAFQRQGVFGGIKRIVLASYGLVYCTFGVWWSWWYWWFCNLPSSLLVLYWSNFHQ